MKELDSITLAQSLIKELITAGSNIEGQLKQHPLALTRNIPKDFNVEMTKAILKSLSSEGRENMINMFKGKDMGVMAKDDVLCGNDADGVRMTPKVLHCNRLCCKRTKA
uniref:Uncharacterized protein n=1 Tax=Spongospora subterranea TaxID=70186 RepID=A0A0H5RB35_9EUKA|eukprot:CRZ11405.1 hypothetical protein [Spongospora subterranea]